MDDPYKILGVPRGADDDAIRKAYRKLAKTHHPDLNPDKPEAMERFKAINQAHQILSDPTTRARFDRGEIDAAGTEKAPQRPQYSGGGGQGFSQEDLEAIFAGGFPGAGRGRDQQFSLTVDFLDAAVGAVKRLSLPDGRTLDVTIPAGLQDGHVLRLKGQGRPGRGAPAGDALVEVSVAPHRYFRRDGNDVLLELPVTLQEAVLGASIEVPTITGRVRLTIQPNSADGSKLRLGKRGIAGGNQIVVLKVVMPVGPDPALEAFLKGWSPANPIDPRAGMA